ncbi:hypothetical protein [uncultured Methylophaga sp.]|uniref:hypothetical protein n=1 Tax=uncultured Methylophaga sp. TaxID=285271 RepID=UPI0026378E9E|nr:hypothetical protein [uncultured Methylophaga sp.]
MSKESKKNENESVGITVRHDAEAMKPLRHYMIDIGMSLLEAHRRAIKRIIEKDGEQSKDG